MPTEMELELKLTQQGSSYEVLSAPASDHSKSKRTIESRAKRSSKIISLGHDSTLLASSHTVKSKTDIKSPTHYPRVGFNLLVHSIRALSALRRFGLRTASTAAKPYQGDSLEFYLITGNIHTDQRGIVVLATLFNGSLLKIQVAQKKVKIAFENADSSSRVELIPSKIKYANKVVLSFHKEFSVFSSFTRKGNDGLLQDQVFKNNEDVVIKSYLIKYIVPK
nr:hypothetical protein [Tanacetum cinerariifolium]